MRDLIDMALRGLLLDGGSRGEGGEEEAESFWRGDSDLGGSSYIVG